MTDIEVSMGKLLLSVISLAAEGGAESCIVLANERQPKVGGGQEGKEAGLT